MLAVIGLLLMVGPTAQATDWEEGRGYRRLPLAAQPPGTTGFDPAPPEATGIDFGNHLADSTSITNQVFLNGSGVALADADGDGLVDLYFCGLETPNRLYRNLGDWRFADITRASGTGCTTQASTGAAFADVDGDGDMDLLVTGIRAGVRLFLNQGGGRFAEGTRQRGLDGGEGSTSMALGDIDGDGDLDLYVVHYRNRTFRDDPDAEFDVRIEKGEHQLLAYNGRPVSHPDLQGRFSLDSRNGILENGQADALYLNRGAGRFERMPWDGSVFRERDGSPSPAPYDWGLSAQMRDLDGDSRPDLYVCNDFQSPDRVWINDSRGRFAPIAEHAIRQTSLFSMGIDAADLNGDGRDDLFVADMLSPLHADRMVQIMEPSAFAQYRSVQGSRPQFPRNTLLLSRGDGTYAEIARLARLHASYWSWCPIFLDVDLDGHQDLLVTTGHWRDAQNADISMQIDRAVREHSLRGLARLRERRRFPRLDTPNVAFRNRGDLTFEETGAAWGFDSRRISHGMALADLDNDGDADAVINCLNAPPLLLRNTTTRPRIRVRLKGNPPNTRGIGARLTYTTTGLPPQSQEILAAGRYLSSDDPARTFAAVPDSPGTLLVRWRNGTESRIEDVRPGWLYEISEAGARTAPEPEPRRSLFHDQSERLSHRHQDAPYNDYLVQGLLPHKASEAGPGITWFDFNRDGREDLIIGGGRNGHPGVFRNDRGQGFVRQKSAIFDKPLLRDQGAILGWRQPALIIAHTNYEQARPREPVITLLSLADGSLRKDLRLSPASHGPLSLGDADADGDLDLFVGAHRQAGRYPDPLDSLLLVNRDGHLVHEPEASRPFERIGMVSSVLFTHLDRDHRSDLVLAGEWMPLRLYRHHNGSLAPWDPPVLPRNIPSSTLIGLWNSVASGDFDGDGLPDLVAGNFGRNTSWPRRRLYHETRPTGPLRLVEAHFSPQLDAWAPVADRDTLGRFFPEVLTRFPTHTAFSHQTMDSLLAQVLPPMDFIEISIPDSVILLNRGDHLILRPLPIEAQFAPVFGLDTGDVDGDGDIDIVLTQNLWSTASPLGRQDAGGTLLLRNDGRARFRTVPPKRSGLASHAQGRGLALCDYDHDGRLDLAIGQNNGPTRLWKNRSGLPGIRLILHGPSGNPAAIGTRIRPVISPNDSESPVQVITSGGGYWSQKSTTLHFAPCSALRILWPDGTHEILTIPTGRIEVRHRHPRAGN